MERRDEDLIVPLLELDPELKRCYQEHQEFEKQLIGFQHRYHLSSEEEIEMKRIQKLKLARKDKMMEIAERYRQK
jgi:uncharacterized protein YdcH (DUF465 family)